MQEMLRHIVCLIERMRMTRITAQRVLLGAAAGVVGAVVMDLFARTVRLARDGREATGAAPGTDRDARGMQPPQAIGSSENDAAVQVGRVGYRAITGREPDRRLWPWLGSAAHYAFSAGAGATYAVAVDALPALRAGYGALYGLAVWAIADEGIMPALNLSRGPRELPAQLHAYSIAGHLVWGTTLDAVCRSARMSPARSATNR